ncbi:hypothetical protein ACS0TY_033169 [Phlomoides rotata]
MDNPLFREIVDQRSGDDDESITVGCEVVLFEHLLWMLENADPQPESVYSCIFFGIFIFLDNNNTVMISGVTV